MNLALQTGKKQCILSSQKKVEGRPCYASLSSFNEANHKAGTNESFDSPSSQEVAPGLQGLLRNKGNVNVDVKNTQAIPPYFLQFPSGSRVLWALPPKSSSHRVLRLRGN